MRSEKKNENTNLIVTSAACSGEAAGCQTLKGTGAEFNASCQGSLMWLSPPARAGIVKLSGAGWGRSNSAAGCPLTVPTPGASLRTQQGVGKHPPSSPKSRCVGYMWLRTCAHVWIHGVLTFFFAVSHCFCSWCYKRGVSRHHRPLYSPFKVKVLLTAFFRAYHFLMHYASVCEAILRQSQVCVHICVCLWVNKNHCFVRLRNIPLPLLSTEESVASSSYRQTLCWLLIYEFVQYDNNNMSFLVGESWCV